MLRVCPSSYEMLHVGRCFVYPPLATRCFMLGDACIPPSSWEILLVLSGWEMLCIGQCHYMRAHHWSKQRSFCFINYSYVTRLEDDALLCWLLALTTSKAYLATEHGSCLQPCLRKVWLWRVIYVVIYQLYCAAVEKRNGDNRYPKYSMNISTYLASTLCFIYMSA